MRSLILGISIVSACLGCSKKSDSSGGDSSGGSVAGIGAGGGESVAAIPVIQFVGMPANPGKDTALNISITTASGGNALQYQYALLTGSKATCTGAKYSAFTDVSIPITDALGADGVYLVCGLGKNAGGTQTTATSYTWLKDATGPVLSLNLSGGFGPNSTGGTSVVFSGNVSDVGSGIGAVTLSVQLASGNCLNKTLTGFDAPCPNPLPVTGAPTWSLEAVADDIFSHGTTYNFLVDGSDKLNNTAEVKVSMPYLSVPPAPPAALTIAPGVTRLELAWSAVPGAAGYVVVRRAATAVDTGPTQGRIYTSGAALTVADTVAYDGTGTTLTDASLAGDQTYFYAVYAYDLANNYSVATTGSQTTSSGFPGLTQVYVAGPGRLIGASWKLVNDGVDAVTSYLYNMFPSVTSGGETYSSPAASFTGGTHFGAFVAAGSAGSAYIVGRSQDPSGNSSTNTAEQALHLGPGFHHRILGGYTYDAEPSNTAYLGRSPNGYSNANGVAVDAWGNQVFSANFHDVYVRCHETSMAPYCRTRQIDNVYVLFGSDSQAVAAPSDNLPPFTPVGEIAGVAVDPFGNVYAADQTFYTIRVQCNNTSSTVGFCAGKTDGNIYRLIGSVSGTSAGVVTPSGSTAANAAIGSIQAVAADNFGNVFYTDQSFYQIMVVCNAAAGPSCSGKTVGNVYAVAGSGVEYQGSDAGPGAVAASTQTGASNAVAVDTFGNVFFADYTYNRVRALCLTTSGPFCAGKLIGDLYRVAGDGTANLGASGVPAASTALGYVQGLAVDAIGNLYVGSYVYPNGYPVGVARAICLSVNSPGFCSELTVGDIYDVAGSGDPSDGSTGIATEEGLGTLSSVAVDSLGNIFLADNSYSRVRMVCENNAGGDCIGRIPGYIYPLIGTGQSPISSDARPRPALYSSAPSTTGMALDSVGNLYYTDNNVDAVFVLCMNVTVSGTYCTGRTSGYRYRIAGVGTGIYDQGTNGIPFATAELGGLTGGIAIDAYNNLFISTQYIRAICVKKYRGRLLRLIGEGRRKYVQPRRQCKPERFPPCGP